MLFWYDENSSPIGFVYTDKTAETPTSQTFFYGKNAFGDIKDIYDETGKWIASYTYNEWGEWVDAVWDTSEELYQFLLNNNPLLYRGYYYDIETGYYYLQSRYYNPEWGRFINADDVLYLGISDKYLDINAYLYCYNNPLCDTDSQGKKSKKTTRMLARLLIGNRINAFATQQGWFEDLFYLAGFTRDSKGVYHTRQDCWQQLGGYNNFYDIVFDYATSMKTNKYQFKHNKHEYVFWAWKGDYLNLGAGAELGIYKRLVVNGEKTDHWIVDRSLSKKMSMELKYKGKTIAIYKPKTKQWWITSFNPFYQNVKAGNLKVLFLVNFSQDKSMFSSFYEKYRNSKSWKFNKKTYTAKLSF